MSDRGARFAARLWDEGGRWRALRAAFAPASLLYRGAVSARNAAYRTGLLATRSVDARIVSVGNVRVGGSGKTPLARWLAFEAQARGVAVAIASRGYGGARAEPHVVGDGRALRSDVAASGDEAVMLARTAGVPVVAGRDRVRAAALAISTFGSRLIVCDDAFQHRRLTRDVDLVLIDSGERRGLTSLLPTGPLREPVGALGRADVIVVVERGEDEEPRPAPRARADQLVVRARFVPTALVRVGPSVASFDDKPSLHGGSSSEGKPSFEGIWEEVGLAILAGQRVLALSAVARPRPLYESLRAWEADLVHVLEYPDHHAYDTRDWHDISHAAKDVDFIVTTEKDLVKLERFPFARGKLVALRLGVTLDDPAALLARVLGPLAAATLPAADRAGGR